MAVIDPQRRLSESRLGWLCEQADAAGAALAALDAARGEVRVRLVGDEEMAAAHERHTGVSGTTDVLTFDLSDGDGWLDVDILVCVDEAARQGLQRGISAERELLLYIVHGVLHCLGYDDHTDEQSRRMHAREDEILERIGVGATYAAEREDSVNAGSAGREVGA